MSRGPPPLPGCATTPPIVVGEVGEVVNDELLRYHFGARAALPVPRERAAAGARARRLERIRGSARGSDQRRSLSRVYSVGHAGIALNPTGLFGSWKADRFGVPVWMFWWKP